MKQSKLIFRILPVLLALCFFIGASVPHMVLSVNGAEYDSNYESLSNEEKQAYLEQQLKEVNKKLDDLAAQSKDTEEYITALDEKIRYMDNQLKLSEEEMATSKNKITTLERQYSDNEKNIASLKTEIDALSKESKVLKEKFDVSYEMYGQRARAMYISGDMTILEALLTSKDISTLMTRIEMIRRVSQQDKLLLETIKTEGEELESTQKTLNDKKDSLINNQNALDATKNILNKTIKDLEKQQLAFTDKQKDYESERSEADNLLIKLQEDTKNYSEFRHQDEADLAEINREIEAAAEKYIQQMEEQNKTTTTTTSTTTTTTKKHTTTDADGETEKKPSTTKPTTTKKTTTSTSSNRLSLTYPVPSQTRITTAYGSAGYVGHTGVDFACSSGSNVVAAESGVVIISKDITSHSNGRCSCSYTGGGYHSYGRYIVIMHDKKNLAGQYVYTLYAHNSSRLVSEGQRVSKGQRIAKSGSTGNSSGPHCHFEVRTPTASYSDCVNPTNYLP